MSSYLEPGSFAGPVRETGISERFKPVRAERLSVRIRHRARYSLEGNNVKKIDSTVLTQVAKVLEVMDELHENSGTNFQGYISVYDISGTETSVQIQLDKEVNGHVAVF